MSFWILAGSASENSKESLCESLTLRISKIQKLCEDIYVFDVPENLKFGSFDSLIKLVDELGKIDSQIESVTRRFERQALDLDASVELNVGCSCINILILQIGDISTDAKQRE